LEKRGTIKRRKSGKVLEAAVKLRASRGGKGGYYRGSGKQRSVCVGPVTKERDFPSLRSGRKKGK